MQALVVPLTLLAIVFVALLAGNHVSRAYRMPDSGWKVSLILTLLGISAVILGTSWPPKQGIDLKGGVILIYEVDESLTRQVAQRRDTTDAQSTAEEAAVAAETDVDMPALIQALSRRINPGGVQEIVVRRYGTRQVEIIIPDVSSQEVDRIKKVITTGGFLRFMIVANQRDHGHIWELADDPQQAGQYEIKGPNGAVVAQWVKLSVDPQASTEDNPVYRVAPEGAKTRLVRGRKEVLMVVNPDFNLQGSHLASVSKSFQDVSPCVSFRMTSTGAGLMRGLTATNLPDLTSGHYSLLGIVMDGELISAPRIKETISGDGIIEGRFTDEEVDLLVNVLRAGRLPAVLRENPISQDQISPLLGSDTIRQGKISIYVSLVAVLGFMLVYYRFAGLVACLMLIFNLMLILAVMIFIGAAFSLPGMAGLVLTVGMSVDANVLIYERIREELGHGATLRMAIRNGFSRAMSAIVDSNITTLITAIVLYLVGTEQLRAFAVTLILGIIMCLFTGVFCSRVFLEIAERRRWITNLKMMKWLAAPELNLFNLRWPAIIFSLILIGIGMGAVLLRGRQVLDIDFLGGTSVQVLLRQDQAMPIAQVRQRAEALRAEAGVQDISVTEVRSEEHGDNRIYRINTSLRADAGDPAGGETQQSSQIEKVKQGLINVFRNEQGQLMLQTHALSYAPPTPPAAAGAPSTPAAGVVPPAGDTPFLNGDSAAAQAEVDAGDMGGDSAAPATPSTPATTPPTETPAAPEAPASDAAPADHQRSQHNSLDGTLLAYAGDGLLAQLPPETTTPAAAPPSTPTPGSEAAAGPAAVPAAAPAIPPTGTDAALNVDLDASQLRSQSELTFDEKLNAETLEEMVKETAVELGLPIPDVVLSNKNWDGASSEPFNSWTLQLSNPLDQAAQILQKLETKLSATPVWLAANQIGTSVAGDKTRMALVALVASLIGIIAYLWVRFEHLSYGLAAVIAVLHDVLVAIGAIAVSYWLKDVLGFLQVEEFKISLSVVAAILTIIGYSLNDTIVIFDRIREVKGKSPHLTVDIINTSINQTLSRTILTSLTVLIVVVILYFFGGQGIHGFAFALVVGVIAGSYSTIFIASPILLWLTGGELVTSRTSRQDRR